MKRNQTQEQPPVLLQNVPSYRFRVRDMVKETTVIQQKSIVGYKYGTISNYFLSDVNKATIAALNPTDAVYSPNNLLGIVLFAGQTPAFKFYTVGPGNMLGTVMGLNSNAVGFDPSLKFGIDCPMNFAMQSLEDNGLYPVVGEMLADWATRYEAALMSGQKIEEVTDESSVSNIIVKIDNRSMIYGVLVNDLLTSVSLFEDQAKTKALHRVQDSQYLLQNKLQLIDTIDFSDIVLTPGTYYANADFQKLYYIELID